MKTIAIIGQKGGTGKTTLAQILLVEFERNGFATAGIDLDPQSSLCGWADLRAGDTPAIIPMQANRLPQTLAAAKENKVKVAIIDTAGRAENTAMIAAKAADLVIMPVQPTSTDLATVENTLSIIQLAKSPKHFTLLMRAKSQGSRHLEAIEALTSLGTTVCPTVIGDRVSYQDAASGGLTPTEYEPGGKAALECQEVYRFVCKQLNMKEKKHG